MKSILRGIASITILTLLFSTLVGAPANAVVVDSLTPPINTSVKYGENISLPFVLATSETGNLTAEIETRTSTLANQTFGNYLTNHPNLDVIEGDGTYDFTKVSGSADDIKDLLLNISARTRFAGAISRFVVRVAVYSTDTPVDHEVNMTRYAAVRVLPTGSDECIDISEGTDYDIITSSPQQTMFWEMDNGYRIGYTNTFLTRELTDSWGKQGTGSIDESSFDIWVNAQSASDDNSNDCIVHAEDGSISVYPDGKDGYDIGNGLTAQYETKFFEDGATARQSVTYTNTTNSPINPGTIEFNASYGRNEYRHMLNTESFGQSFSSPLRDEVTVLWGGDTTTIANGNKFAPDQAKEFGTYQDLAADVDRINKFQNMPSAYFEGLGGTIANWGPNSIDIELERLITTGNHNLWLNFPVADIPAGESITIVVFQEIKGLGVIRYPEWATSAAPDTQTLVRDQEIFNEMGMTDNQGLYTYEISNGALPAGLSIDNETGFVSGVITDPVGDYEFEITATPDPDFPELGTQVRSFTYQVREIADDYSFEGADLAPWQVITRPVDLGVDYIAGCKTVDTTDYSNLESFTGNIRQDRRGVINEHRRGIEDNTPRETYLNYGEVLNVYLDSTTSSDGSQSIHLRSDIWSSTYGYDVIHGPVIISPLLQGTQNFAFAFDWRAIKETDSFAVLGYLLNVDTCEQTEMIDMVGDSTDWQSVASRFPTNGNYRFVFVHGSYDKTGGRALGADMYLDNFRFEQATDPAWTDTDVLDGSVGENYNDSIAASGGPAPRYTVVGGSLPPGLELDSITGAITGTPTEAGTFNFKVEASNGPNPIYHDFTINIDDSDSGNWTDKSIATMQQGSKFADAVDTSLSGDVTYSVTNGELPAGLKLNPKTGAITGTPILPGDYYFQITATNGTQTIRTSFSGSIAEGVVPPIKKPSGTYKWKGGTTKLAWKEIAGANSYTVYVNGVAVCTDVSVNKCTVNNKISAKAKVTVKVHRADGLEATGKLKFLADITRLKVTPHFDLDSAVLHTEDKVRLKKMALYLKKHHIKNVILIGYTDVVGPSSYDRALSLARAWSVQVYMSKFMDTSKFIRKASGRANPAKSNATAAGRAANRRVELWFK